MTNHFHTVQSQFDPQAQSYLASKVHAQGPDLALALKLLSGAIPPQKAYFLDLGCGAGHLSYTVAGYTARTVATDPSPQMLAIVERTAKEKGLGNIETIKASADLLPFTDGEFCVAASRYSAHHWLRIETCIQEMRRVVKTGGYLLMIDVLGHEDPLVDTHLQALELLRDRSHVRNLKASEWRALIAQSGFELLETAVFPLPLDFISWIERMHTPKQRADMILTLEKEAPSEVREALHIKDDGSFTLQTGLFWAKAV